MHRRYAAPHPLLTHFHTHSHTPGSTPRCYAENWIGAHGVEALAAAARKHLRQLRHVDIKRTNMPRTLAR